MRSVLLSSVYNAWPEVFNGQSYAFLNVINSIETAEVLAPEALPYSSGFAVRPAVRYLGAELALRSFSAMRRRLGLTRYSSMRSTCVEKNYDLFFFMCQHPIDLSALQRIRGWRERCGIAVAYMLETWSDTLPSAKAELRVLDEFDYVFVLNAQSMIALSKFTKTPVFFLPSAADCMISTPYPHPPDRSVDVYSMGRRIEFFHEQLTALAASSSNFFYLHDTMMHGKISSWSDHRLMTANIIKRSKFFPVFEPSLSYGTTEGFNDRPKSRFPEEVLSTRYFEGAAGGAIMVGSSPKCPEFAANFDWPDAVIEIPSDVQHIQDFLVELANQPERLELARMTNATESLRRHDWAHRWKEVLGTIGLEPTMALHDRIDQMSFLAARAEAGEAGAAGRQAQASGGRC